MSNPFIREEIEPPDPHYRTFTGFIHEFCETNGLEIVHEEWAKKNFLLHVPLHVLALWEAFPEWPPVNALIDHAKIAMQVYDPPCANCEAGKQWLCTGPEGNPIVRLLVRDRVIAEF